MAIEAGLGAAQALFGRLFPSADAVRALPYFGEGDFRTLTNTDRLTLTRAVSNAGPIIPADVPSYNLTIAAYESDPGDTAPGAALPDRPRRRTPKAHSD